MPMIAVTGASGLIGHAVASAARSRGLDFRPLSRKGPLTFDLGSARVSPELLRGCDAVVHLAAHVPANHDDPAEATACWEVNALGTLKLMEAMTAAGVEHLIQTTAANAYAPWCATPDEHAPLFPPSRTYYLASKVMQEYYAHAFGPENGIEVTSLRVSSVYGSGSSKNAIARMARALIDGNSVQLDHCGSFGGDFILADDVADSILLMYDLRAAGTFNVGIGRRSTMLDVARQLVALTNSSPSQLVLLGEPCGEDHGYCAPDIGKIAKLGFRPRPLHHGLQALVRAISERTPAQEAAMP